ncbi:MAG: hypothetical protein ACFFA1_06775 [Promethearchaeota archaeon]
MRIENSESGIKKDCLHWAVLKCLHKTLRQIGFNIPTSVDIKLELARSIINTGWRSTRELEELLDQVERILIRRLVALDRSFYWMDVLIRTKNGEVTRNDILGTPHMRDMVKKYEFLDSCIPPSIETGQAIEASSTA